MTMKYIKLFYDQSETVYKLSDNQAGKLFKAIFKYVNGEKPDLTPLLEIIFVSFRQGLDRNKENFEKLSKTNSANAKKRWEQPHNNANASDGMRSYANAYKTKTMTKTMTNINNDNYKNLNNTSFRASSEKTLNKGNILEYLSKATAIDNAKRRPYGK